MVTAVASYVVGTAGHIDHGKSALVKALTGIDPDRLEEEKRRGMTIDLGFAFMDLKSGRHVGIVDVPGHQRFLKNMLAGVHGIDAVLLVVAADEGPMPQTHEHVAILDLLGVRHGVVALTKVDLVEGQWLELVEDDLRRVLRGRTLQDSPIVPVSSVTGQGLDALREALDMQLAQAAPRPDLGRPRLWIDRSFTMAGFGTVVTGTLVGGALEVGQELALLPGGRRVRVRGLQQHNRPVDRADPGSRTAVNLAGVERREVERGEVLAQAGVMTLSRRIDARIRVLDGAPRPIRHRTRLLLYQGTAEAAVEVLLLGADRLAPGAEGFVQLYVDEPLPTLKGDRFILRQPSPATTVAGGVMVDVSPRRHRRSDPAVVAELRSRERLDPRGTVALELGQHRLGLTPDALARRLGMADREVEQALSGLIGAGAAIRLGGVVLAAAAWEAVAARLESLLRAYHASNPLREGMPREELKSRATLPVALFQAAIAELAGHGRLREQAGEVALPDHHPRLAPEQEAAAAAALGELEAGGFSPPPLGELVARHRLSPAVLQYLLAQGRAVRVNEDTAFSRPAYEAALARLRAHLDAHQRITVAQARDLLGSSRRYVLPLLEWLDAQKITRRVGDDRILRDR